MNVNQMREFLMNRYSLQFAEKVKQMPDNQVIAVYYRTIEKDRRK